MFVISEIYNLLFADDLESNGIISINIFILCILLVIFCSVDRMGF